MEFIFGNTLIASNLEVANRLAFSREVGKHTVTIEGDTVNPSGALSGGRYTETHENPVRLKLDRNYMMSRCFGNTTSSFTISEVKLLELNQFLVE